MIKAMKPVVKWAGGKRQIFSHIRSAIGPNISKYQRYFEPFFGGGAVLFELKPDCKIFINDLNEELMNMYLQVRDNPKEVIRLLEEHERSNSEDYYYSIRGLDRLDEFSLLSPSVRAARFIYLNRACYSGIYRVNRLGEFNVPFAKNNKVVFNYENIMSVSEYLHGSDATITHGDFVESLRSAQKNDLVFLDPPYFPLEKKNSFDSYTKESFGNSLENKMIEQERLLREVERLVDVGCDVVLCNSNSEYIKNLYYNSRHKFYIKEVKLNRYINSKHMFRSSDYHSEIIITNINEHENLSASK